MKHPHREPLSELRSMLGDPLYVDFVLAWREKEQDERNAALRDRNGHVPRPMVVRVGTP